ncbi:MAG: hypothetical protein HC780_20370 [Leptolyngbyaceae cyanobacterium CSU_1_3]|nr:hypothetical protein [Leptolyngbyaceae cyanobacterium CSU_1_3]
MSQTFTNAVQRSTSEPSPSTNADSIHETPDEWSSLAELIGEPPSTQTTELSNQTIKASASPPEATVTLVSPLIQAAPQTGEAKTAQKNEKVDAQEFEQLAQSVYRLIQTELAIERERYWNHDTAWVNSAILSTQPMKGQKGQATDHSQLSTTDVKLQTLAREIQLQLQQQLDVERERQGCRRSF